MPDNRPSDEPAPDMKVSGHDPMLDETLEHVPAGRVAPDLEATVTDIPRQASLTTSLATVPGARLKVFIPPSFLSAGSRGSVLRLVPIEHLRGRDMVELYFRTAPTFLIGRSPLEVDWLACFFPRNEKNDLRSRRLSKVHARLECRDRQLELHRVGAGMLQIGGREVTREAGQMLKEGQPICLAEDYILEAFFDSSLQNTLRFENGSEWRAGKIEFENAGIGAVRFEPINSRVEFRNSCWLFVNVGFGSARGGVLTAGYELAPHQGVILRIGGCFWILNLVDNGKVSVNETGLASHQAAPLTQGDSVWLGAIRYRAEIS